MLQKNPLFPPVPLRSRPQAVIEAPAHRVTLVAAEDFDATGILVGMDPSASRYWWLPELYGPDTHGFAGRGSEGASGRCADTSAERGVTASAHATSRAGGAPPAAA